MEKKFAIVEPDQSWKQYADDTVEAYGMEIFDDGGWDCFKEIENKIQAAFPNIELDDIMSLSIENVCADTDEEISEYENYLKTLGVEGKGVYDDTTDDIFCLWMPKGEVGKYFEIA